jgi:hypothetical protein
MPILNALFCENKRRFFGTIKQELDIKTLRRVRASRFRYCVAHTTFYAPVVQPGLDDATDRLCWVRSRDYMSNWELGEALESGELNFADVDIGNDYIKRSREHDGAFDEVETFVSQELYNGLVQNPEALATVSKDDFEGLCAELFVRRGFEVDLFRSSVDGGIDFIAFRDDKVEPFILAVQCKQPDVRPGKPRKALGSPVVQQIYGAAKAWDLSGAAAISGATYSLAAQNFADLKPSEIFLYDQSDISDWIRKYRWNDDE